MPRQEQNGADLKYQGAREGNQGGGQPAAEKSPISYHDSVVRNRTFGNTDLKNPGPGGSQASGKSIHVRQANCEWTYRFAEL